MNISKYHGNLLKFPQISGFVERSNNHGNKSQSPPPPLSRFTTEGQEHFDKNLSTVYYETVNYRSV